MKNLVLVTCAAALATSATALVVSRPAPTRVRLPSAVARSLEVSPHAAPTADSYDDEGFERLGAAVREVEPALRQPDAPDAAPPVADDAALTGAIEAGFRARGLEVEVPAMVLYAGPNLDGAITAFREGFRSILDERIAAAQQLDALDAHHRAQGMHPTEVDQLRANVVAGATLWSAVAGHLDDIAASLDQPPGDRAGRDDGAARAALRARFLPGAVEQRGLFCVETCDLDAEVVSVSFRKSGWQFSMKVPQAVLGDATWAEVRERWRASHAADDAARRFRESDAFATWQRERAGRR